ncbi:MAG: hypothetical protein Q4Q23_01685 [Methanobacteriaceae archaeon]|nr:hypothetical protein [Methanobacteriaceae archaeon]
MCVINNKYKQKNNCEFFEDDKKKLRNLIENKEITDKLFSFLIENNLNRYIFGYILRIKDFDIDNIPFEDSLLNPERVEEFAKESFIKKYECESCNYLLFRNYDYNIPFDFEEDCRCPYCCKKNKFDFNSLNNDFHITRKDLYNFLNKLADIGVFNKESYVTCSNCTEKKIYDGNFDQNCSKCGKLNEIKFNYSTNYFSDCGGFWFEWYVYNLCLIHYPSQNVFYGYKAKYDDENNKEQECELDILVLDGDNPIIYECKDYMGYNKKKLVTNDLYGNLSKINKVSDKIVVVSSTKEIKEKSKEKLKKEFGEKIEFLECGNLEKKFLNAEKILEEVENKSYVINSLYEKINEQEKKKVLELLIEKIKLNSESKGSESKVYFECLIRILNNEDQDIKKCLKEFLKEFEPILKDILKNSIANNLKNNQNISAMFKFIRSIYDIYPKIIINLDMNLFIKTGIPYLNPNSFSDCKKRAPFYYFICSFFKTENFNDFNLDESIIQNFLLKFIDIIPVYYGCNSFKNTLNVFLKLWGYKTDIIENKLITSLENLFKEENCYKKEILSFLKEVCNTLSKENQNIYRRLSTNNEK